jgi:quinol monooxygenase YgiN
MGIDGEVTLTGTLICTTEEEAARVRAALDSHIALTRAETGCLSFEVTQSNDPMIWTVSERFVNAASFEAHQIRAGASDWAVETKGITRDYKISGL